MRHMDQPDNPHNGANNNLKRDNSNHSSPVPASSPTTNIRVNSILRVVTIFDVTRVGKVVAYDGTLNLVTLHIKGTKPDLTSVAIINLNHCREYTIEQEPKEEIFESLYPIDINKIKKRQAENEAEKRREASFVNIKASRMGQALFRDIKKTMNQVIRWSNNDILINNNVRIVEPYRSENVSIDPPAQNNHPINNKTSAKSDNDTKTHIMKLVDKFWSDQSKSDSTRNAIDSTSTASVAP